MVVAPPRPTTTTTTRPEPPPDWAGFTRYINDLRAWLTPPKPAPARAVLAPQPPRAPTSGQCATWIARSPWPAYTHAWLYRTILGESGCNPRAYNPSPCAPGAHAVGLTQLCWPLHSWLGGDPYDPAQNLAMAWRLCLAQPTAWSWHGRCR